MMEAVHATEEWQRAGVHYIRIQAMCVGFDIPLKYEFADDTKDSEYILVHENGFPVSTCRVRINEENAGHIERVATLEEYRGKHYGALGIKAAEQLLKERGVTNIRINSREKALGFYEKLGYTPDFSTRSGEGEFVCIMTQKHCKFLQTIVVIKTENERRKTMAKLFDFEAVLSQLPEILKYLPTTLILAVSSMILALIIGMLLALIKTKNIPVLKQIAGVYISLIRGTPVIVQLYIAYFGIPMITKYIYQQNGWNYQSSTTSGFVYAIIALSINESAYIAEIFRGALASVNVGQIEAASAIGMTYFQTFRRIIFPEMLSVALPGLGNSFIGLIKGTSLAFVCAVVEMTAQGKIIGGRTYRYFEVYVSLAIIYWVITFVIEQGIRLIEKKMQIPDQVAKVEISEDERGV